MNFIIRLPAGNVNMFKYLFVGKFCCWNLDKRE